MLRTLTILALVTTVALAQTIRWRLRADQSSTTCASTSFERVFDDGVCTDLGGAFIQVTGATVNGTTVISYYAGASNTCASPAACTALSVDTCFSQTQCTNVAAGASVRITAAATVLQPFLVILLVLFVSTLAH